MPPSILVFFFNFPTAAAFSFNITRFQLGCSCVLRSSGRVTRVAPCVYYSVLHVKRIIGVVVSVFNCLFRGPVSILDFTGLFLSSPLPTSGRVISVLTYSIVQQPLKINTFKYHVPCHDGNISVRIILITYFSTVVPLTTCVFFPVGLSLLM